MPAISVIVPVYNKEQYVKVCLSSIINQTLKDIEIVCIDDGSEDNSTDIIEEIQTEDGRVKLIKKENTGVGDSRNVGISNSNGKYICFMDPDDYYPDSDILESLFNNAEKNGVNICGGSFSSLRNGDMIYTYSGLNSKYVFENSGLIDYQDYQFEYGFQRFIYSREFIINNKITFPNYIRFQDPPFLVKAMTIAKTFYALDKVTYCYRESYKDIDWTLTKKIDNIQGMIDCIATSSQLYELQHRLVLRITSPYYTNILSRNNSRFESLAIFSKILEISKYLSNEEDLVKVERLANNIKSKISTNNPTFSIIVPVYNVSQFIRPCLDSLINQDFKDFEVICVDDGSPDDSGDICEEYANKDQRFKVIHRFNGGLSNARNTGADYSNGKYIYFLDSDDLLKENALSEMYSHLNNNNLDILFFDAETLFDSEELMESMSSLQEYYRNRMENSGIVSGKKLLHLFNTNNAYRSPVQLSVVKSEWYHKNHLECYPGILHEDNLYTLQALKNAKRAEYVPKQLYIRRVRDGSIMTTGKSINNFYGFFKCYSELNNEINTCDDTELKKELLFQKEKLSNAAKIVFENLSPMEQSKINEMSILERIILSLDPPFSIPGCWKKENIVTWIINSSRNNINTPLQSFWDLDIEYADENIDLNNAQIIDTILTNFQNKINSKFIIITDSLPEDSFFISKCLQRYICTGEVNVVLSINQTKYYICENPAYIQHNTVEKTKTTTKDTIQYDIILDDQIVVPIVEKTITDEYLNQLRELSEKDPSYISLLCKCLWEYDTSDSISEAIRICTQYYQSNIDFRDYLINYYIADNSKKSVQEAINLLETYPDNHRILDLIKLYWTEGSDKSLIKMKSLIDRTIINTYPETVIYLSKLYETGKIVNVDYDKAEKLLRYAISSGISRATNELIGVLWKKSDSKSIEEMHRILPNLLLKNSKNAYAYMGRAYRDGKGVDKNLLKAADCFRHIKGTNIGWDCELYDILNEIGTKETKEESKKILNCYSNINHPKIQKRLKKHIFFNKTKHKNN